MKKKFYLLGILVFSLNSSGSSSHNRMAAFLSVIKADQSMLQLELNEDPSLINQTYGEKQNTLLMEAIEQLATEIHQYPCPKIGDFIYDLLWITASCYCPENIKNKLLETMEDADFLLISIAATIIRIMLIHSTVSNLNENIHSIIKNITNKKEFLLMTKQRMEIIQFLILQKNFDRSVTNAQGKTAAMIAQEFVNSLPHSQNIMREIALTLTC